MVASRSPVERVSDLLDGHVRPVGHCHAKSETDTRRDAHTGDDSPEPRRLVRAKERPAAYGRTVEERNPGVPIAAGDGGLDTQRIGTGNQKCPWNVRIDARQRQIIGRVLRHERVQVRPVLEHGDTNRRGQLPRFQSKPKTAGLGRAAFVAHAELIQLLLPRAVERAT